MASIPSLAGVARNVRAFFATPPPIEMSTEDYLDHLGRDASWDSHGPGVVSGYGALLMPDPRFLPGHAREVVEQVAAARGDREKAAVLAAIYGFKPYGGPGRGRDVVLTS